MGFHEGDAVNVEPGNMWMAESLTWAALAIVGLTGGGVLVWVAFRLYGWVSGWGG